MRVKVYRNLKHGRNTPPLYSIMHKGRVISRVSQVLLCDATFVVHESGRQRVLRDRCKNVHAFVVGLLVDEHGAFGIDANGPNLPVTVTYNPYRSGYFESDHGPIKAARAVLLNASGISACYVEYLGHSGTILATL